MYIYIMHIYVYIYIYTLFLHGFLFCLNLPAGLLQTKHGVKVVDNGRLYMLWQMRKKGSEATQVRKHPPHVQRGGEERNVAMAKKVDSKNGAKKKQGARSSCCYMWQ